MTTSKDSEKIRVPAPILTIIHVTIAILLGRLMPLPIPAPIYVQWLGLICTALGFMLGVLALIEFKRVRAAADPKKPMTGFVTSGVYHYTRNPVYLGFVLILIGFSLSMRTYWGILLVWPLITLMNNLVIKQEESYLEKRFKNQYADYKSKVRRWL